MSNLCIELGRIPPVGTPLLLKVGAARIDAPQGSSGTNGALWNIVATFPSNPQMGPEEFGRALRQYPQGFAVAFSVSGDELPSVVHGTIAMSHYFGFPAPQRILQPGDPLNEQIPDLNAFLGGEGPHAQVGTNLRQPAVSQEHTLPWFLTQVLKLGGLEVTAPQLEEAPPAEPVVVAPPITAVTPPLALQPGALEPLEVKVPVKPKKTTSRKKRSTKAAIATG